MSAFLTNDTKAIILLCGVLGKDRALKPLTQREYTVLVNWLIGKNMRPEDLLEQDNVEHAAKGAGIDQERFKALLARGVQLGFAVEEWQRNGIWIISRSDKDYPVRYKRHLKDKSPPLLFGIGDRSLLQGGGVAIVGSRNVDVDGQVFARNAAELCAYNRMPVVSGGARGVDQISMTAALDAGGITLGVLADNLLKKSLERNARNAIAEGRMVLISPYHPNARFTVGTAMGRNRLIYALADYALVVNAEHKTGGTWAGATEELKRENPLTLFVRSGADVPLGNKKLLESGAIQWPEIKVREHLKQQLADVAFKWAEKNKQKDLTLFDSFEEQTPQNDGSKQLETSEIPSVPPKEELDADNFETTTEDPIYEAVLPVILDQIASPLSVDEL
jgi:predicted Rossmann fold nucleotide-binding protein DprA/Smf involved in DNA uptake